MSEFAKDLRVSKTTIYRAEKGKQVFNYKLLFNLVLHGVDPEWLLLGEGKPHRRGPEADLLFGQMCKVHPEMLRKVGPDFDRTRKIAFPVEADERLLRLFSSLEALYLQGDESQREALATLVTSLDPMFRKVDPRVEALKFPPGGTNRKGRPPKR